MPDEDSQAAIDPLRVGFVGEAGNRIAFTVLSALLREPGVRVEWMIDAMADPERRARLYAAEFDYGGLGRSMRFLRKRRARGRRHFPVEELARKKEVTLVKPSGNDINTGLPRSLYAQRQVEFGIVAGCDQILNERVLSLARNGFVNYHYSLLPAYRGKNALFWQWWDRAPRIGFTFHRIDMGVDTGERLLQREVAISSGESLAEIQDRVLRTTADAVPDLIRTLRRNEPSGTFLDEPPSYRRAEDYNRLVTVDAGSKVAEVQELLERLGWFRLANGIVAGRANTTFLAERSGGYRFHRSGIEVPLADGALLVRPVARLPFWIVRLLVGRRLLPPTDV